MNLEMLKNSDRIIFECIAGSKLYNLNVPGKSDTDIRGLYKNPPTEYLGLSEPANQIGDEKHDTTYYSLKRFFELAMTSNPNIIELLWVPKDCRKIASPIYEKLEQNRGMFISKKCYHTHSGYAFAQIQKAKGQNKMVHNPQLAIMPKKEDFCWIIPISKMRDFEQSDSFYYLPFSETPFRPIPFKDWPLSLKEHHVSALEHVSNTYRLYFYGKDSKGVFRGNDMLVCESIPFEDEAELFRGLLIYNQNEFEKALNEHRKYTEWMENRNENRWIDQEKGLVEYDCKNMMHCLRLLISGENILTNGYPLVRFEGKQRDYLMKIRAGEFKYEELMADVEKRMAKLEELYKTSTIPHSVNTDKIDALYRELAGS